MSLLFTIIRAAHANGTHHKLALDALTELQSPDAEKWRRLFLKHAEPYLAGAKAPDTEFKDFKNHVLHVRENFWGGAPERAQHWYGELVEELRCARWPEAARAAGILSHYAVDPLQPLHTGQSDAENAVHRAIEWSISRSYDDLRNAAPALVDDGIVKAATGPHWLASAICAGAGRANAHYESLIAHYDLKKGVVDPPAGLDANSRRFIGVLIRQASALHAHVLDRAFLECGVTPPDVPLTAETVMAALKIPAKQLAKRISNAETRAQVEAIYHELTTTGKVEATLDEENRTIRDLHQAEVTAARPRPNVAALFPVPPRTARTPRDVPVAPAPVSVPAPRSAKRARAEPASAPHARLTEASPLVDAHSIGPKTAARFEAVGITTVGQFLAADAGLMAASLHVSHIKAGDLRDWQDQARLGCGVPALRGGHTQMLVMAGCRTREALAAADPAALTAAIEKLLATPQDRERLRLGNPPALEMVTAWVQAARRGLALELPSQSAQSRFSLTG